MMESECWGCGYTWSHLMGGSEGHNLDPQGNRIAYQPNPPPAKCPACGHLYMTTEELKQ